MSELLGFLLICLTVSIVVNVAQGYRIREQELTLRLLRDHGSDI